MKVLMVSIPQIIEKSGVLYCRGMDETKLSANYAVYMLAGLVKKCGHFVDVFDLTATDNPDFKHLEARASSFDVVCFSANSLNWAGIRIAAEEVKAVTPGVKIIAGGIHPTLFDEHILKTSPVDLIVRGEAEKTLPAVLDEIKSGKNGFEKIPGLSYIRDGKMIRTGEPELVRDKVLEQAPFPLYEKIPPGVFLTLPMETSRGYPYFCPFCASLYQRSWRYVSPAGAHQRLNKLDQYYNHKVKLDYINVVDDYFTAREKRIFDLYNVYLENNSSFKIAYNSRCSDIINQNLIRYLTPFTSRIHLGAGCGYNRGLLKIKKGFTTRVIRDSAANLQKHGLARSAEYSFIVGFPWETPKQAEKTIDFAADLCLDYGVTVNVRWHHILPGSYYWNQYLEEGKIDPRWYDSLHYYKNKKVRKLASPLFEDRDFERIFRKMEKTADKIDKSGGKELFFNYRLPGFLRDT